MGDTKFCGGCTSVLPYGSFWKSCKTEDGLGTQCKWCAGEHTKRWVIENEDRVREIKKRSYEKNKERYRKKQKESLATEAGRKEHNERSRKYKSDNPEKVEARLKLNGEIRRGNVMREPCEVCGVVESHGHHDDYSKPLEVRWLCPTHHAEYHAALRAAG